MAGANAGVGEDPLRQRALDAAVVLREETVPEVVLGGRGWMGECDPGYRRTVHHRGAEPSESGSPPMAAMPSQSAQTSEVAGCKAPHLASRNSRSNGWPRRLADVPAAASIDAATSAAVSPASSFARQTHRFVSVSPGAASTRRAASR